MRKFLEEKTQCLSFKGEVEAIQAKKDTQKRKNIVRTRSHEAAHLEGQGSVWLGAGQES